MPDNPNSDPGDLKSIILPDGTSVEALIEKKVRQRVRQSEDEDYVPVIIKRTDETRRHPDDALQHAIEEGLEQLHRPAISLFLSAIAGGLIVGFSAMAAAVVLTALTEWEVGEISKRVATAVVYPLGFIVCILSGAQLFTEHTATALYPILDRRATVMALLRLWGTVIGGNLVGALLCAGLHTSGISVTHAEKGFLLLAEHLVKFSSVSLFVSAVLAGWLMALGAWLVGSSPRTIAQIASIYIVTFLIGLGGLHHSIAGSVEMLTAALLDSHYASMDALRFVACALTGNLVGGSCFVALLNYAHIRRTNE